MAIVYHASHRTEHTVLEWFGTQHKSSQLQARWSIAGLEHNVTFKCASGRVRVVALSRRPALQSATATSETSQVPFFQVSTADRSTHVTPSCWQQGERITLLEAATAANRTTLPRGGQSTTAAGAVDGPLSSSPSWACPSSCHPRGHAPAVVAEQVLVPFSQLTGVVAAGASAKAPKRAISQAACCDAGTERGRSWVGPG